MTTCRAIFPSRFFPLINDLLTDLIHCWQRPAKELLKVEAAFLLTKKHCTLLKYDCWHKPFGSEQEGIAFVKRVHPQFSGRLIYYSILYEALLSQPEETEQRQEFWENEQRRLGRFEQKHAELVRYLDSGATDLDRKLFLLPNQLSVGSVHTELFNCGPDDLSLTDSVPSNLFGERSYHQYVQSRLTNCR